MANKYKQYALQKDAQIGEVVMTYGVKFVSNPDYKPHLHNQNRPYLVLHKDESGRFLALKLTNKVRGYMSEFRINPAHYPDNKVLSHLSAADVRHIVELDSQDIVANGFVLENNELNNLLSKIMKLYSLGETSISDEHAKTIFDYYIQTRVVKPGCVIKVKYCANYLLVISEDEENYSCLPLYRSPQENTHDEVRVLAAPSYVDYDESYTVDKKDPLFIMSFETEPTVFNHIRGRINSRKRYHLNQEKKNNQ